MNESEGKDEDFDITQKVIEIYDTVREIFDGIFDGRWKGPLKAITRNEYWLVWQEKNERNAKVTCYGKIFLQAITKIFHTKHTEAVKHIEDIICFFFFNMFITSLISPFLVKIRFDDSCKETKNLISNTILRIKGQGRIQPRTQGLFSCSLSPQLAGGGYKVGADLRVIRATTLL